MTGPFPVLRLKAVATITPSNLDKAVEPGEVPARLCNYVDVYRNDRITGEMDFMQGSAKPDEVRRFALRGGEVLITKDSETPDDIAVPAYVEPSAAGVLCGYHLAILRPRPKVMNGRFLFWALKSAPVAAGFTVRAQGITRYGLTVGGIGSVGLPVAPLSVQKEVADFLDRETARIDALVAKQDTFIVLLDEQRRAIISEAVTGGVGRREAHHADAGAALAALPTGWMVKRLKHLAAEVTVGVVVTPSKYYADFGVPALRSLNIRPMEIVRDDLVFFDEASNRLLSKSMIRTGDLVAIRTGKPGTTAVVGPDLDGANCIDLILIRRSPRFDSRFMAYVMNSDLAHAQYAEGSEGALQQHFNIETAKNLLVPAPPLAEQKAIAAELDMRLARHDALRARAVEMIERLREHRAALITAAVTGGVAAARPLAERDAAPARAA